MNISVQDLIALATVLLPFLIPLGGGLYKHIVDNLPSNQRQAVVDAVRVATHALEADPSIEADANTLANNVLKELHLPANPNFVKSLVAIFQEDLGSANAASHDQGVAQDVVSPASPVGFAPPAVPSTGPSLRQ
jgi:hypothetical protein